MLTRICLTRVCWLWLIAGVASSLSAQQVAQPDYQPPVERPEFAFGTGPQVIIDDAHHNFHTADGRYQVFADMLRRDGYRVGGLKAEKFDLQSLQNNQVLIIVNAVNERNQRDWSLPTPSAFEPAEIQAVRDWVSSGGSLWLIADHMPFPGSASDLAKAFGVIFSNGYAQPGHRKPGISDTFEFQTGLWPSVVTCGRTVSERVNKVATFGGSAFIPPEQAIPIILFKESSFSMETTRAPGISKDAKRVSVHGWCQGAIFAYGQGRVAVFGEAAMFTAQRFGPKQRPIGMNAPVAAQNHQLALNVIHWLSRR